MIGSKDAMTAIASAIRWPGISTPTDWRWTERARARRDPPRLLRPRPGRAYAGIEGPRGQYAAYVVSDGTDQPFRMRIHDPSYLHLQSVGLLMPGHLIADAMAVMASLDPIMGGVDK